MPQESYWAAETATNTPEAVNPTIFSVGRPVGGAGANKLLSTDANGYLTTIPSDVFTGLAALTGTPGLVVQTALNTFTSLSSGTYSLSGHVHPISGVTGLQTALDSKAASSLTLQITGSTGLTVTSSAALDLSSNRVWGLNLSSNLQAYSALPTGTFATSGHTHAIYAEKSLNLSDLNSPTVARTNLGLGTGDSPVFTGVYSSNLYAGTTSAVSNPGALTVVRAAAFNSEGNASVRIFNAAASADVVLQMGADSTNDIGFIQAMQPGVAWTSRPLTLQANGGSVTVGTTGSLARLHVRGSSSVALDGFRVEALDGTARFIVSNAGAVTISSLAGTGWLQSNVSGALTKYSPAVTYTVSNPLTSRTIDVSTASLSELREFVGTLVSDLKSIGILL